MSPCLSKCGSFGMHLVVTDPVKMVVPLMDPRSVTNSVWCLSSRMQCCLDTWSDWIDRVFVSVLPIVSGDWLFIGNLWCVVWMSPTRVHIYHRETLRC
jgi:hypothetical protein